jgi:hypothetical protein
MPMRGHQMHAIDRQLGDETLDRSVDDVLYRRGRK